MPGSAYNMDYTPGFGVKKSPLAKMTASHGNVSTQYGEAIGGR